MENKIIKYLFSFILAIVLFISEIFLIVQYNLSRGITKEDINKIIDNINIEKEIIETKEYEELKEQINPEILQEIIQSEELNSYIKENIKTAYTNILYNEKNTYINSKNLKQFVNNIISEQQETLEITEEEIEFINEKLDNITKEVEQGIEDVETFNDNIKVISTIMSKTTTTYMFGITIIIGALIILINRSKEGYLFIGLTTIIVGIIFFVLWLSLSKTIYTTGIDDDVIRYINAYLPKLLNFLKKSSIITIILGTLGCITYTLKHYQEVQENGKI